jgi:hypothetical protein
VDLNPGCSSDGIPGGGVVTTVIEVEDAACVIDTVIV